jgi:large subunit ribosomal protein L17
MSSHRLFGRQLSRDTEHRKAMRRNLVQSLFEHGKVRTTLPKALEVKALAERLITLARTGTLTARRKVIAELQDRRLVDEDQEFTGQTVIQKLFTEIGPRFVSRPGGYTRIIKLSDFRIGDAGSLVLLQLLSEEENTPRGTIRRSAGLRRKRNERRHQFAARALKQAQAKSEGTASEGTAAADSSSATATATPPGEAPKA